MCRKRGPLGTSMGTAAGEWVGDQTIAEVVIAPR
jgi:hypothetical protein